MLIGPGPFRSAAYFLPLLPLMLTKQNSTTYDENVKPTRAAAPYVTWRLLLLGFGLVAALAVLGARLYFLTVLRGPYFYDLTENNFLYEQPVRAPRGGVFTSDGTPLSINRTVYQIEMSPFRMRREQIESSLAQLGDLLGQPELADKADTVFKKRPAWEPVVLVKDLELETIAPIRERLYEMPGVIVSPNFVRYHPYGSIFGHITGYIRQIDRETLDKNADKGYLRDDLIGKAGIERTYEDELRGVHGTEIYIRDARGRPRSRYVEEPAKRGNDVILTIDYDLQLAADSLLQGHLGAAIVMDPRDGAILALASKPDYDPNDPMRSASREGGSSYNKVTRGRYAPASTFKLITAAAGLGAGRTPDERGSCPGNYYIPGVRRAFWCDIRHGHGWLDLHGAIQKSCNVYFYRWANQLGRDRMIEVTRGFGFGEPTGIDLLPEGRGLLAQPDDTIYMGSVVQMGIGQGALIAVTPIQLLNAYAALANGGTLYRPHLIKEVRSHTGELVYSYEKQAIGQLPITENQRVTLIEGFRRVVQKQGGTAYNKGFQGDWDVSGKTGSAEVFGQKLTNGWFVAFAPTSDPEIAIIALVEAEGHGGSTAAPIVKDLMSLYFGRKKRLQAPATVPSIPIAEAGSAAPTPEPHETAAARTSTGEEAVPEWARRN